MASCPLSLSRCSACSGLLALVMFCVNRYFSRWLSAKGSSWALASSGVSSCKRNLSRIKISTGCFSNLCKFRSVNSRGNSALLGAGDAVEDLGCSLESHALCQSWAYVVTPLSFVKYLGEKACNGCSWLSLSKANLSPRFHTALR